MLRVGLLGFGEIGRSIAELSALRDHPHLSFTAVCCRDGQVESARRLLPDAAITTSIDAFLEIRSEAVVEAAGQKAIATYGEQILSAGRDLYILSTGALAQAGLLDVLMRAALANDRRICLPAGALAGFDGLQSMRMRGLTSVTYRSIKPPSAWRGTDAEAVVALDALTDPVTFFRGSAREAAQRFPRNANLAASVALAGLGFDDTMVELVADPGIDHNDGVLMAESEAGSLFLSLSGKGFASNPKSSMITGMSVLAALNNQLDTLCFC